MTDHLQLGETSNAGRLSSLVRTKSFSGAFAGNGVPDE